MYEGAFKRSAHRQVLVVLSGLDRAFLENAKCWFGGGTRIVLELSEYRESKHIDFLSSDRDGYRQLREVVTATSLGGILQPGLSLAREVRADQYGIRTFIETEGVSVKFEVVREARIDVEGEDVPGIPVACLTRRYCFAEKFLANADRGLDASTLSRDLVDLAFMIEGWSKGDAQAGMVIAKSAYGDSIRRSLAAVISKVKEDRVYRNRCIDGLGITDRKALTAGIRALATLL